MTREEFLDKEHAFVRGTDTDVVRFYHTTIMKIFDDIAKEEKEITDKLGKSAEETIASFIVNQLGINLCSVKTINVDRQKDGQIKEIKIEFIPDNKI